MIFGIDLNNIAAGKLANYWSFIRDPARPQASTLPRAASRPTPALVFFRSASSTAASPPTPISRSRCKIPAPTNWTDHRPGRLVDGLKNPATDLTGSAHLILPFSAPFAGIQAGPDTKLNIDWEDIEEYQHHSLDLADRSRRSDQLYPHGRRHFRRPARTVRQLAG